MPGRVPSKDFNNVAGPQPGADWVVGQMDRIRRNLDMAQAALDKNWAEVERLAAAGADPAFRDMTVLRAFAGADDLAAAKLAEKLSPGAMADLPLIAAAETGNKPTVDYILARNPPDKMVGAALSAALRNDQRDMADVLYARLKGKDLDDEQLIDLMIRRPELYAEATKARSTPPDYILHFMKACEAKDSSAMARALDAMQAHRATLGPNIERHKDEFDIGMGHQTALMILIQSGHVPTMARYFDNFADLCPTNLEMFMIIALAVSPKDVNPLQPIIEKFKPDEKTTAFAFTYAAQVRNMAALKYLSETFPDLAQKNAKDILAACAAENMPEAFFGALKAGYKLPPKAVDKADLLAESLMANNADVTAHLESNVLFTPAVAVRLQNHYDLRVLKKVAEAVGDWHFRDDVTFWRALGQGDAATLAAIPQDKKISIASPFNVEEGLRGVIARGDFAQLQAAFDRMEWDATTREGAFNLCLSAPGALATFDFAAFPPRPLGLPHMRVIAGGTQAAETLALLEEKGFKISVADAFEAAVELNNAAMAEYLFSKGADVVALTPTLLETLDRFADQDMTAMIGKWAARRRDNPDPALAARIAAATPEELFGGPDSLAIAAAYAGQFPAFMKKAGAFDPALLHETKDDRGNSLLDILGAHGRLNDALVPDVWMERDAKAFLNAHLPPCYLPQCDINGLTAAINQLHLKNRGRDKRLKGP